MVQKTLSITRALVSEIERVLDDPRIAPLQPILGALVVALTERAIVEADQETRIRELDARVRALEASVSPRVLS